MSHGVVVTPAPRLRLRAPALVRVLELDALSIAIIAAWVAILGLVMPALFVSDTWLSLVDGRFVAQHGLPHTDTLTAWSAGRHWTDQQWGAQLLLYGLVRAGGLAAAACFGIACVAAALLLAVVAARRLGGSPRSTAVAIALPLVAAPWTAQLRAQTLALPLFVAVYALLAADTRRPGRRVLLALPILAVWANLHGSVTLAAGLCALYGATILRGRRAHGLALLAAPVALVVSPYGLGLVGYYRLMLASPPFAKVVDEWRPMSVQGTTVAFFLTAFAFVALASRHRRVLAGFEQWSLVLLLVAALDAARNAVWFELALAVVLPRLLDAARPAVMPTEGVRRINRVLAPAAVTAAAVVVASSALHPLDFGATPAAAAAVSHAAGPHGLVLADDLHADWLLWERPELAGRVAYDVRFELYTAPELRTLVGLDHAAASAWRKCGGAVSVVTFAGSADRKRLVEERVLRKPRLVVAERRFGAFTQDVRGAPCGL